MRVENALIHFSYPNGFGMIHPCVHFHQMTNECYDNHKITACKWMKVLLLVSNWSFQLYFLWKLQNLIEWITEFGLRDWKQRCNAYKVWKKKWEKCERRAFVCKKSERCRCALVDRSPFITRGFVLNLPFTSVNHVNPEFGNENLWVLIRFTKFPPFSGEPSYS